MQITRRSLIHAAGLAVAAPALTALRPVQGLAAAPPDGGWRHGLSLFGDVRYPEGFRHFEYVNPDAPKGGVLRMGTSGTFDNFNPVVAGVKGNLAGYSGIIVDTLTAPALDEVATDYGLLAEAMRFPPDFSSVVYRLRAAARWHDGKPVTPEDVIFSFEAYKAHHPRLAAYYGHVVKVEKSGEREVTFVFDQPGNRELPQILGALVVLPKHWWEGTDQNGNKRDIAATTSEPPLGSGPYRIKEFVAGHSIVYERVADYWGKDLPLNVGQNNFDEFRVEYYRDLTVSRQALKADQLDWRVENSAKDWATGYDFPAVREKRVVLEEFPMRSVGIMQALVFNTRRDKFKDPRLRRAFNFAYDFEELNKQIFYNQYQRISSYFEGTDLASSGLPEGKELEILETVRDKVPRELFTTIYKNPVNGNPEAVRANTREATRLLKEAGYEVRDTKLVNTTTGEPLTVEFLLDDPSSERLVIFLKPALERLGIDLTLRAVDNAQYQNRLRQWDFDMVSTLWSQSLSPGNEQRYFWGSEAADTPGTRNLAGIKNPAVDTLIERIIFAKDRDELVAATRALDRVLLWNHYVVPQFYLFKVRTARWDRFGRPEILPKYGMSGFPIVWWWDPERAARTGSRG
jgi:microcin C transport system substrate-binding protein